MRIYLPATTTDVLAAEIIPRWAHALTDGLRAVLPEEDDEGCEASAVLAAADDSLLRLRAEQAAAGGSTDRAREGNGGSDAEPVPRRVVIVAEVPASIVRVPETASEWRAGDDRLPSAVEVTEPVAWRDAVAVQVDEAAAGDVVRAAIADDAAIEAAAELELMWFDAGERDILRRELAGAPPTPADPPGRTT